MEFPCFVLHRSKDVERESLIDNLKKSLSVPVKVIEAFDGEKLKKNGYRGKSITGGEASAGVIGCLASHVVLVKNLLMTDVKGMIIFEDDAVIEGDIFEFLSEQKEWDILLFGTNEIVEGNLIDKKLIKVQRFWGTHAMCLTRRAMESVCEVYAKTLEEQIIYPADWLYNRAIKEKKLRVLAPTENLVNQKKDLVSTITGNIRK